MIGLSKFNDLKLLYKMTIVSMIGVLLFFVGIFFVIMPKFEDRILQEKKLAAEHLVEMAMSILESYAGSQMSPNEARRAALLDISKLRYDGDNYVWISDLDSSMVMHPIKPELNGKDMSDFQDPSGKKIFREFSMIAKKDGEGFLDYMWPKPGYDQPVAKISYLKLNPQWGWILGTGIYVDDVKAQISRLKIDIVVISLLIGFVVLAFSYWVSRNISRKLSQSVRFAERVAGGDFRQTMNIDQSDEVGDLAVALNEMVANLRRMFENIVGSVETLSSSSTALSAISQQISAGTEQSMGKARSVTATAEEMSANMQAVADASEQTSSNVQMVAAATDEMTATIGKISGNTEKGRAIAGDAVAKAKLTSAQVDELGSAVQHIGQVTETIAEISEQTNLLALNATIEAARAGEAGKGFAVVAGEIKDLAGQTAAATKQIADQIHNIQIKTGDTVGKIDEITTVINDLSDIVTTLASAMEEQSATTGEIARSVNQAALGNEDVNKKVEENNRVAKNIARDMAEINQASQEIAGGSAQVHGSAMDLATMAEQLQRMIGEFRV